MLNTKEKLELLNDDDIDFITTSLNILWHSSNEKLQSKSLGDLERIMHEKTKIRAKELMDKLE